MARLPRKFYEENTVDTARSALGKFLVHICPDGARACRITETEAYIGRCDRACHAYGYKRTNRTAVLFSPPGHAYLYFVYGMHWCLNLVTEPEGEPAAVLIRGGEAAFGMREICLASFGVEWEALTPYQRKNLLNGLGKLCKGMSLTGAENGMDLTGNVLFLCDDLRDAGLPAPPPPGRERIRIGPRVGIDYAGEDRELPWRFRLIKED